MSLNNTKFVTLRTEYKFSYVNLFPHNEMGINDPNNYENQTEKVEDYRPDKKEMTMISAVLLAILFIAVGIYGFISPSF